MEQEEKIIVFETERLLIRWMQLGDAQFVIDLLNSEGWLKNIGDRKVRTILDAETYLENKVFPDYQNAGFGMYLLETKDGKAVGMSGLVDRPGLEGIDIGFAMLTKELRKGYALEANLPMIDHARQMGIKLLKAITLPSNEASKKLLEKLGFNFIKDFYLEGDSELLSLYELKLVS